MLDTNWNPKSAYAIGLITTDGNLSKDGRHIIFVSKDKCLVKTFKSCLSLNNKIGIKSSGYSQNKKKYYYVQFSNIRLYKLLLKIGITPRKSKSLSKIKIPRKYFSDFLRGHLNGDGFVRSYKDTVYPNSHRIYTTFMSASKPHLLWMREKIKKHYGLKGKLRQVPRAWNLVYAKKESIQLLNNLYYSKRVPALERKRKLVENFIYYN